jgi:dTDP-glucose pyrophosphorylase
MQEKLIGLIPAAGKGVRLGLPYPKELYPVIRNNRYKPVAQFVLDNLVEAGVGHIAFVINETKHQLIGYFGSGQRFGCDISYVVQDQRGGENGSTSPGLAHALDSAYHLVRGKTVCFGMADTIMQPTDVFGRTVAAMQPRDEVALAMFATERPEKFGMVDADGNGCVAQIVDKPSVTDLQEMWGCIVWRPRFTEHLHRCVSEGTGDFAAIMNSAIADGMRFRGVQMQGGVYIDLGTYEEIMEMDHQFREE